jgi:uncharacterized repeat protein (TIGR01451 family)
MKSLTLLFAFISASLFAQDNYYFTATDINGTTHDIQEYIDDGIPVLFMSFVDNWGQYWAIHEDGEHVALYNSIGQGGTGEIAILYIAGAGFDSEAEIYDVDYSADLGAAYTNVNLTENNPIPIIVAADNPQVPVNPKGERFWLCPNNGSAWLSSSSISGEEILSQLYNQCCTVLEGEDPALQWTTGTIFNPACSPSDLSYVLSNKSDIPLDQVNVDIYLNGIILENAVYVENLPGCSSVTLDYSNAAIQEGDEVMMAIGQANANLFNDTIAIIRDLVDTVGTTIKIEVLAPSTQTPTLYFAWLPGGEGYAQPENNWFNYIFLEPGCYSFFLSAGDFDSSQDIVIAGSVDENDTYVDTIFYGAMSELSEEEYTLFVEGETAVQKMWGYVFEDSNQQGYFSPNLNRIEGIEVTYGSFTTFTNADGYYEFEGIIPVENVSIAYDETVWPVYTTLNAGNYSPGSYIHNFGLNSSDPFFELTAGFDFGLPYFCEVGLGLNFVVFNTGNQPTSGELVFTYDPVLTPIDFNPEPASVSGNEVTYSISEIQYGGGTNFSMTFEDISADLLGELISADYTLSTFDDQGNVVNVFSDSHTDTLFCAYDPNDKYGFPLGEGDEGFIPANTPLKYRIRFQNTGNFPATIVVIRDTLPEALNWESFVPSGSTHENTISMNSDTREVVWTFDDIQLPDSASDPFGSIGSLWFDIEMANLEEGDLIENTAYIFFDQNEAIVTNTSLHTIAGVLSLGAADTGNLKIYPNPANDFLVIDEVLPVGSVLELYEINGRLILQNSSNSGMINLSNVEEGMYFLRLQRNPERVVKVVVSR